MTSLDSSYPDKRAAMPSEAPSDLKDRIKQAILDLVGPDHIQAGTDGSVIFTVVSGSGANLNNLLYQADHYGLFDYKLRTDSAGTTYEVFSNLFPDLDGQTGAIRNDVRKTFEA